MGVKLKLNRFGSYPLKEYWLIKGINALANSDDKLFKGTTASRKLGLGTSHAEALKYWLIASKIVDSKDYNKFTDFGNLIIKYDRYVNKLLPIWLIHYNLVTNVEYASAFSILFNEYPARNFTEDNITVFIKNFIEDNYPNNKKIDYLSRDVKLMLRSYSYNEFTNPEDDKRSVLARLKLLKKGKNDSYEYQTIYRLLNYLIVYYVLCNCLDKNDMKGISVDDIRKKKNNPFDIFHFSTEMFYRYLNEMRLANLIIIERVPNTHVVINKKLTLEEIFELYYNKKE